jgi:biopolymer transport protein ExbD
MRRTMFQDEADTKIDLSSMIDCVFILLIFFIVTTVFVEETGVQVAKPDAAANPSAIVDQTNVRIEITADGKITLDDREIALADVTALVKAGLENPETPVVIRAHEKARHGTFVAVWDAARRGGAQMLSFNTVN